jgi:hypothetical protein
MRLQRSTIEKSIERAGSSNGPNPAEDNTQTYDKSFMCTQKSTPRARYAHGTKEEKRVKV